MMCIHCGNVTLSSSSTQNIAFKEAVQARYLKYEMLQIVSSRVSLLSLLPYLANE